MNTIPNNITLQLIPEQHTPGCSAYFHLPPVWMIGKPENGIQESSWHFLTETVFQTTLPHGIKVRVRRDGIIVFDCASWIDGGPVVVPGYQPSFEKPHPSAVSEAEQLDELHVEQRVQLINAHIVCLNAALFAKGRSIPGMGTSFHPSQVFHFFIFENDNFRRAGMYDPMISFIDDHLNYNVLPKTLPTSVHRQIVDKEVLEHSFWLLREILNNKVPDLLNMIHLLCHAGSRWGDNQFAEALIIAWTVSECLLSHMWNQYLESHKTGMNKDRRKKLTTGRDYSASVISEVLQMAEILPLDLYQRLNESRSVRNGWIHDMSRVSSVNSSSAIRTAFELLMHVTGLKFHVALSRSGMGGGMATKDAIEKMRKDVFTFPHPYANC